MSSPQTFPVLDRLLLSNKHWAEDVADAHPHFFADGLKGQAPKVLWIGCGDSRVPESVVLAAKPGDLFVHRNIANQFHPSDVSANAVLSYAVNHVGVEHVIIAGHTSCGGAAASLAAAQRGDLPDPTLSADSPINAWLAGLVHLAERLRSANHELDVDTLVHESVKVQVEKLSESETITAAWANGKKVYVHGWVYGLADGKVQDLGITRGPK